MYSAHNEKTSVAERFIITLKNKIYKCMTSVSKNVYIDKLHDAVKKNINTYHSTVKMNHIDVKSNTYIDSSQNTNDKILEFKTTYTVIKSKYKIIFAKDDIPNWSVEDFVIKKVKNIVLWHVINDPNEEKIIGIFYKKELQKPNLKEFKIEKVITRKDDKLFAKQKGNDNSLNS